MIRTAVFLDRDGTLNIDPGYISNPDDLVLIDGAALAVKRLNDEKVYVVVITNQSGVGRGYYTEKDLISVNGRLRAMLHKEGARIDAIYFCPHRPDDKCPCRKPEPGLVEKAARELHLDLESSFVIGDKLSDIELAHKVGAKAALVMTGKGSEEAANIKSLSKPPDFIASDVSVAVEWVIDELKRRA